MSNTIFIQIASYRDPQLLHTLRDALDKAKYPENLRFAICWQHSAFNIAAQNKQPLIIYGDGEQTRDFISVNDICNCISKFISVNIKNETFNIGSGKSISINTLAKQFGNNIIYKEARKEVRHSCADVNKIKNIQ